MNFKNYIYFLASYISKPIRFPSLFISFLEKLNRTQLLELEDFLMQKVTLNITPLNVLVFNLFYIQARLMTKNQNQNRLRLSKEFIYKLNYRIKDSFLLDQKSKSYLDWGMSFYFQDEYAFAALDEQLTSDLRFSIEQVLSCLTQISFQKQVMYNQKMKGILVDILALLEEMSFEDRESSMLFFFWYFFERKIKNNVKGRLVTLILKRNIIDFSKFAHVDLPLARKYVFLPMLRELRRRRPHFFDLSGLDERDTKEKSS